MPAVSLGDYDFLAHQPRRSPNEYLAVPPGWGPSHGHRFSPIWAIAPAELFAAARKAVEAEPRTRLVAKNPALMQAHHVCRTLVFRFVDDVLVRVVELEEGRTSLAILSRARLGYSDFGVNGRRVERILVRLQKRYQVL